MDKGDRNGDIGEGASTGVPGSNFSLTFIDLEVADIGVEFPATATDLDLKLRTAREN